MKVQADNREAAVAKLKEMMTQEAVTAHMAEKHPGDPVPTVDQVHQQIEAGVTEVHDDAGGTGATGETSSSTPSDQGGQPAPSGDQNQPM